MTRFRLPILAAVLSLAAADASAQNFFERLFGITPSRPQAPAFNAPQPPPEMPAEEAPRRVAPAAPVVPRPVAIRAPSEDTVIGRDLRQNGSNGSLRIERAGRGDLRAHLTLVGRRSAQSVETCSIPITPSDGAALVSQGRPEGTARYQLQDPTCPLQLDLLDESVLVKGPTEICTFQAASCQADPSGLWGPEPAQLTSRVRDYEAIRASADRIVRDNYKVMASRAAPAAMRPIIAEQAAFSADRETLCRSYAREGSTSFCNARFTEARAMSLASRLGITTASADATRAARRRPDPYGLPSTDEIMQRRQPADDD